MIETRVFVEKILREQCFVTKEIHPESELMADLGLDSMAGIVILTALEIEYGIDFDTGRIPPKTVEELVRYVEELRADVAKSRSDS